MSMKNEFCFIFRCASISQQMVFNHKWKEPSLFHFVPFEERKGHNYEINIT